MEDIKLTIIQHLAESILTPLVMWLFIKLFRFDQSEISKDFDYNEIAKLANKRTKGCFINFFLLAILLTAAHHSFWLPLYEWSNKVDNIVLMSKPTIMESGLLAFYFAFPLSIIVTKYRFQQNYGTEKVNQLNSYFSITQNVNNHKAEKWLLNSTLILSIIIMFYFLNNIAIVTDTKVYYTNSFSIFPATQAIESINNIEVYEGSIAPNGDTNYRTFYKVFFTNQKCWEVTAPAKFDIVLYLAKKKNISIENKGIAP